MKLDDYIYYEGISQRELARRLDIHFRYLHGLVTGEFIPARKLALKIEEITQGKVTALELLLPKPAKPRPSKDGASLTPNVLDTPKPKPKPKVLSLKTPTGESVATTSRLRITRPSR